MKPINAYLLSGNHGWWIDGLARLKRQRYHAVEGVPITLTRNEARTVIAERRLRHRLQKIVEEKCSSITSFAQVEYIEVNDLQELIRRAV
jgi:hypothetical protein